MSDLLVPGDERADGVLDDAALLTAVCAVEEAWSVVLASRGLVPATAALEDGALTALVDARDAHPLSCAAEGSGNPVVPLLVLARERLNEQGRHEAATWLHRGLTSQDVLDTALVLGLRAAAGRVLADLRSQAGVLRDLTITHRDTLQAARTLTQHAVPTTFGLVCAGWLDAVLDVEVALAAVSSDLPVQAGGAAGTLSAVTELAALSGEREPATTALGAAADLAGRLDLLVAPPWHTRRRPLTAVGDALVGCTDVWGAISTNVLVRARPELGELREGTPGVSSTMPHKVNPVLAALVRRAALSAPAQAAVLHTSAALAEDERSAGAWHAEWSAVRTVARTAVVAASQATELLTGLVVDADRMRATARAAAGDLLAEQRSLRDLCSAGGSGEHASVALDVDGALAGYLGAAGPLVDAAVARADACSRGVAP